ncbi:MAG: AraC family transcriptional regulator ligand-binding domain-containing protein [Myxococcota bacterium]
MKRHILAGLLQAATQALHELGLTPDSIGMPNPSGEADGFIEESQVLLLMQRLMAQTRPSAIPLAMARVIRPEHLGAPGFAMQSAPTLADAFERLERYHRLASGDMHASVTTDPNGLLTITVERDLPNPTLNRIATEIAQRVEL